METILYHRTKVCPKCGRELPIDEFPWRWFKQFNKLYRDCYCKECRRKMSKAHYWANHEEILAKVHEQRRREEKKKNQHGKGAAKQVGR